MGRQVVVRILVVLGAIVAMVSLLAGYVRFQGLDTPTVKDTAGELIADPVVRDEIAATLVDQLYANVAVNETLGEQLPPNLQGLAGPIAGALRVGLDRAAVRLLERPRAQELWVNAIGLAHGDLVLVLKDESNRIQTEDGKVVLNLRPLLVRLGEQIGVIGRIEQRLPADAGRITIMESEQLSTAQTLTRALDVVGSWLWLVPLALWAVALWLARGFRRSILRMIAWSAVLSGVIVLVIRRVAGSVVIDSLAPTESLKLAAGDAWDILTGLLRDGALTLVGIGVVLLVAAWIAGPSKTGVSARQWLAPHIARAEIAFGAAAALLILLIWWGPTAQTHRLPLILATAVLLAFGVEVLRRQTAREFPQPAATAETQEPLPPPPAPQP